MDKRMYQIEMERLFHKNQLMSRIRSEFETCKEFDFEKFFTKHEIPSDFGFNLMAQMVLHKRAPIKILVGLLRKYCDSSQHCADLLYKCATLDIIDWSPVSEVFIMKADISQDVKDDIDRYQYPLPMIVEPKKVKNNFENGYLTSQGSLILKNNHHDDDICLDHINKMNSIKFRINHDTAHMIKNEWKNLDKPKEDETMDSYKQRVKQFEKYDRTAKDVMVHIEIADNEFYLTHKYDKRGRVYCQGYHVNYQGTAWNKAVIEFHDGETVI